MLLNIPSKQGALQISNHGNLQMVKLFNNVVWQVPSGSVRTFIVKPGTIGVALVIQTGYGSFLAEIIAKQDFQKLQACFPDVQTTQVVGKQWEQVLQTVTQVTPLSRSFVVSPSLSQPLPLAPGQFQRVAAPGRTGGFRHWYVRQKRGTKAGLGCLTLVVLLIIAISIGTAASGNTTPTSNVVSTGAHATPTLAATSTPESARVISTVAPTATSVPSPTPTATSVPTPTPTATSVPTPTPTSTPVPVQPTPTPQSTGVNGNPWGYNFTPGNLIYNPNTAFCSYFICVSTFWKDTNGYVVECGSGHYSHSGGVSGACSRNGDVQAILYSH